ncbi:TetR/AcrR family transcriptional regulator [Gordonia desulfuricans]|uniref:TetR/AcrR family transcriptional regulator n=1 Tax=Gordonia desulfuricans TaxID=89051 RepID=A0A7K3LK39_9ACTN|nr:TetR/AcrR family transcriptional regulator [Gordonia desulfuricans]NDK88629.1 TetR/AcrR family transcriptional regulator [Gordonia desulfuricans]
MAGRPGRKEELLATFIAHVARRGYDQTNLGDIAAELGMSKGTIVHHFGTKAQMLRDLEKKYVTRRRAELDVIWRRLDAPADRVAAVIYASVRYHVIDRAATVATQREVIQLDDDPEMQAIRQVRTDIERLVRDEIARGITAGIFRRVDADVATMQIFGATQWMWTSFDPAGWQSAESVGAAMVDVTLGGLLADRCGLAELADPAGRVGRVVRECLAAAGPDSPAAHTRDAVRRGGEGPGAPTPV